MKLSLNTFLILVYLILPFSNVFAKSSVVGVFVKGFEDNCFVTHNNKRYECTKHRELYIGDTIETPSINELGLILEPYVKLKHLAKDKAQVIYIDTLDNTDMLKRATDFIKGFLRPVKLTYFFGTTRGNRAEAETDICSNELGEKTEKPGRLCTVLFKYPIDFTWNYEYSAIVFESLDNKEVFRQSTKGTNNLTLLPKKIGLKRDTTYNWYYEYESTPLKKQMIRLLDRKTEKGILRTLKKIKKQKITPLEKIILKSTYLQLMSDTDDNIELYWLSYQILPDNLDALHEDEDLKKLVCKLKFRYKKYLKN
ncbi:MAG: hypothetical protein GY936_06565 [Ignavibacteriae bacterium]|nr:hypothetical protein [Ignavibacteriota bacterium]